MAELSTYVDVTGLSHDAYGIAMSEGTPRRGVLIEEGADTARHVVEAFPPQGYDWAEAMELRQLVLDFNKKHHISPTIL